MNPADAPLFRRRLLEWYQRRQRPLPWRKTHDPYRIWVSEVMLQQTQVKTVQPYYVRFIKRFPTLRRLAGADLQDVLKQWEGLGYYARARNLHRACTIVLKQHGGRVPDTWGPFRVLPGVGDYIAAAVLSIAFNRPHAVVDGNVKRLLARLLTLTAPVNRAASHRLFQEQAARLLDRRRSGDFNQAMMELGALVCTPSSPQCPLCPLVRFCAAHRSGATARFPRRVASRPVPEIEAAVGVVFKNGRVLITQRPAQGLLGGLWEFPGGKLREGEGPAAACVREIKEEVNLEVVVESALAQVRHAYSHFRIRLHVFRCRYAAGRVRRSGPAAHRWVRLADLDRFAFPKANRKFIPLLSRRPKAEV
ncbi:MAG: A/G-specific adenine glycosylase [Desulfobacterales bacterium]|jgi:A/G-specific adenine glycosylase|nr:A/G-specific adenine glycosylase [Desulfobacterales bacterium]